MKLTDEQIKMVLEIFASFKYQNLCVMNQDMPARKKLAQLENMHKNLKFTIDDLDLLMKTIER